jgi:hypothetical protein
VFWVRYSEAPNRASTTVKFFTSTGTTLVPLAIEGEGAREGEGDGERGGERKGEGAGEGAGEGGGGGAGGHTGSLALSSRVSGWGTPGFR